MKGMSAFSRSKILRIDITRKIRIAISSNIPVDLRLDIAANFIGFSFAQTVGDDILLKNEDLRPRTGSSWQIKYSEQFSGCD
jgi:hypothetical protein